MGYFIGFVIALFLDIILGAIVYSALSITSMHPLATNLITTSIMGGFFILELVLLGSNKGGGI